MLLHTYVCVGNWKWTGKKYGGPHLHRQSLLSKAKLVKITKIWYFDLYDKLGQTNTVFQPVPSPHSYRLCPNQMVTANDDHVELEDNIKKGFHRIPPLSWVSIGGYSAFPNYFSQHWNTHTEDIWFIEEESRLQCWYPNCRNTRNARWARVYFAGMLQACMI